MALAIEAPENPEATQAAPSLRRRFRPPPRDLGMDPVVYMSDVVRVVGRHRSTILRWIERNWFPQKSVPREHPTGWLRSDIESWQRGRRGAPRGSNQTNCRQANKPSRRGGSTE
jgi:predicted DNA-binding transcriptional regulator AlpA